MMNLAKTFILVSLLVAVSLSAYSQNRVPRFEDYGVRTIYNGKNASPKIGKDYWSFRTRIREAAKAKRNFAGEYSLAWWGCGAECLSVIAINVRTGKIFDVPFTICCWSSEPGVKTIDFRLKSRLVVFTGIRGESEKDAPEDMHYYEFRNGAFHFIKTLKGK